MWLHNGREEEPKKEKSNENSKEWRIRKTNIFCALCEYLRSEKNEKRRASETKLKWKMKICVTVWWWPMQCRISRQSMDLSSKCALNNAKIVNESRRRLIHNFMANKILSTSPPLFLLLFWKLLFGSANAWNENKIRTDAPKRRILSKLIFFRVVVVRRGNRLHFNFNEFACAFSKCRRRLSAHIREIKRKIDVASAECVQRQPPYDVLISMCTYEFVQLVARLVALSLCRCLRFKWASRDIAASLGLHWPI